MHCHRHGLGWVDFRRLIPDASSGDVTWASSPSSSSFHFSLISTEAVCLLAVFSSGRIWDSAQPTVSGPLPLPQLNTLCLAHCNMFTSSVLLALLSASSWVLSPSRTWCGGHAFLQAPSMSEAAGCGADGTGSGIFYVG